MNFITYDMFKCYKKNASSRPSRRVPAELSAPVEKHIDEFVNVPIPSEPSQARPSHP